jgi:hypothetical protein
MYRRENCWVAVQGRQLGGVEDRAAGGIHVRPDQPGLEHPDQRRAVVGRRAGEDAIEVGR